MSKLDVLWAYQEAETRRAQVENAIRSTPNRMRYNKLHKLLKSQQATIAKLSEELDARTQQCDKLAEQIKKLEERLEIENSELATMQQDEESTAEEMTELRQDIERLNREINISVRDAKALLSDVEKATDEYQKTRLTAGKAKKEYDQLRVLCEEERSQSQGEIDACDAEIGRIAKTIDPALLERYNKVKLHHAAPIAKVINNKCGGCNMSLPMVVLKRLAASDAIIECENCGRILYAVD